MLEGMVTQGHLYLDGGAHPFLTPSVQARKRVGSVVPLRSWAKGQGMSSSFFLTSPAPKITSNPLGNHKHLTQLSFWCQALF